MTRAYVSHKRRLVTPEEVETVRNNKPCPCCGHTKTAAELGRELGWSPTTIHRIQDR